MQELVCNFCFASCKTSQNVNNLQLLNEVKSKFQNTVIMDAKLSKFYALFFLILVSFDAAVKKSMMLLEKKFEQP